MEGGSKNLHKLGNITEDSVRASGGMSPVVASDGNPFPYEWWRLLCLNHLLTAFRNNKSEDRRVGGRYTTRIRTFQIRTMPDTGTDVWNLRSTSRACSEGLCFCFC